MNCNQNCQRGKNCTCEIYTANSDGSDQQIEMYPDNWQTIGTAVVCGFAAIGVVALCAAAGFVSAIYF